MPTDFDELKRQLLQTDEEFRQLASQHHDLDEKLHNLATRHYLSEPEQLEEVTLKKRKLHLKDQMETIVRRRRMGEERAILLGQRALQLLRMPVGDDDGSDLHGPSTSRYTSSVRRELPRIPRNRVARRGYQTVGWR